MTKKLCHNRLFFRVKAVCLRLAIGGWLICAVACNTATKPETPSVAAARHWNEAQQLKTQQSEKAGRLALAEYQQASQRWEAAGDHHSAARALKEAGDLHLHWSEAYEALNFYQQARNLARAAGAGQEEAAICNGMSAAYLLLSETANAETAFREALTFSQQHHDTGEEARAVLNHAEWIYAQGESQKSLRIYGDAIKKFESVQDISSINYARLQQGYVHLELGRTDTALQIFTEVKTLCDTLDNKWLRAQSLIALGALYASLGEGRKARTYYHEAKPLIEDVGDKFWHAALLTGLSAIYRDMQRDEWALVYLKEALSRYEQMRHRRYQASLLLSLGRYYLRLGEWKKALNSFEQAECLAASAGDNFTLHAVIRERGHAVAESGDLSQAQLLYRQAYGLHQESSEMDGLILVLDYMGRAYLKANDHDMALRKLNEGMRLAKRIGNRLQEAELSYGLALVAQAQGQWERATEKISHAIKLAERQRLTSDSASERSAYFAYAQNYFRLYIDLLIKQKKFQQAFEVNEQARARELNALLSQAEVQLSADKQTIAQQKQLRDEIRRMETQLRSLPSGTAQHSAIENNKHRKNAEYDELMSDARAREARTQALQEPAQLHLKEFQQSLPTDTLLLEFVLGESQSYLWEISSRDCRVYQLAPRREIEKVAQGLLQALRPGHYTRSKDRKQAFDATVGPLSQMLLAQVAPHLGQSSLLIVADGILQYVPFAALHAQSEKVSATYQPLMMEHEISYLPSASTLSLLRANTARRHEKSGEIHVFADPLFSLQEEQTGGKQSDTPTRAGEDEPLPRLPETQREAEAIRALAPETRIYHRASANVEAVKHLAARHYRAVHFATHATPDTQNPELSAIFFAAFDPSGKPIESRLHLSEIYQLPWSAELVVLSACETALGHEIKGEGLVNLARGFMFAGSPRILASLWNVDDEATNELMQVFYRQYLKDGQTPRAALRAAQLALWQSPAWNYPWHWAAFTLQGEFR